MSTRKRREHLDMFFFRQEKRFSLYLAVEDMIRSLGPVSVKVMKTQITFGTRTKFAWVWPPQPWDKKRLKDCIILTFGLDHLIENEKIVQALEPYPGRWTHHVVIREVSDLDDTVYQWLKEAYAFSENRAPERRTGKLQHKTL